VNIHCAYPKSGPKSGPYPVVVLGHGLQLPPSQYYSYLQRLATFGYIALTVDFPDGLLSINNPNEAKDLLGGVDWALAAPALAGQADSTRVGTSGHSLGGKLALLAASLDMRVGASFLLDPVDGGGPTGCSPPACVEVKDLMPSLHIPTGFIGETTDSKGAIPCAPASDNFLTFYAGANSPGLSVTALGANHLSFLDDKKSFGLVCKFCQKAAVPDSQVAALSHALMVAFFERYLRGETAYDTYLTGEQAQLLWVATGQAVIASK
jgi:dienelactone hydrolase